MNTVARREKIREGGKESEKTTLHIHTAMGIAAAAPVS